MGFEDMLEISFWIKFAILFIPLTIFIFNFAPNLKWKILLGFGGVIGIVTALTGSSLRKR